MSAANVRSAQPEETAAANPALLGLPLFVAGSVAFGLFLVGYNSKGSAAGMIPIILLASGLGLALAAIWGIMVGQGAIAAIFGILASFWLSFGVLVIGLNHNWFGGTDGVEALEVFLLAWLITLVLLTLATLRLPLAFTALFVLVDAALLFVYLGTMNTSTGLLKVGGWIAFGFSLVAALMFLDATSTATGGKALPLGKPLVRD
ncbi:MAG TPA: GPR1/FUN34/YaaH family transporter [Mycobacteriales bacterium]|nr:GPR1/FUN34/YaaH family transporter [Mycobacteriales bacterium]